MTSSSSDRIRRLTGVCGLVGPSAACLCLLGFWHVYLNTRAANLLFARIILVSFSILMIFGGAVHSLWTARGLALKYCYAQSAPCSDLAISIKSYWTPHPRYRCEFSRV